MMTEGIDAWEAIRRVAAQVVFTTHTPVPAGHDRFSPASRSKSISARCASRSGSIARRVDGPGPRRRRHDHDEAFCMTVLALKTVAPRQCRVVAARPGVARHVDAALSASAARRSRPDRPHHQRRPRARAWLAPQMRQVYDRHLGSGLAAATPAIPASGSESTPSTTANCGRRTRRSRRSSSTSRAGVRRSRRERRGESAGIRRAAPPGPQPRRADHRLRAALRHLQARRPDPPGYRGVRCRSSTIRRCRCNSSSPARRIRTTARQGRPAADRSPDARPAIRRQGGVHRRLRHQRRPASRAGRRRVAQQPAPSARSCGTSGQKVVLNGGLNLSILDGWWAEAYDGLNGFAIGMGETHSSTERPRRARRRGAAPRAARTKWFRSTTSAIATACRASGSRA